MRWPMTIALTALCLVGCQNKKLADSSPVLGPPPPRTSLDNGATTRANNPEIEQVSAEADKTSMLLNELDERVVARVGGEPVFAADVLRPFRPFIETQRGMLTKLPPDQQGRALMQMNGEVSTLLDRSLADFLDRQVVLHSIKKQLKPEQIESIEEQIDVMFNQRVQTIVKAAGLASTVELEELMVRPNDPLFEKMALAWREGMGTAPGTSLSEARDAFGKMAMAAEFLRAQANEPGAVDRSQMLDYYREHAADYDIPLELRWQQISIGRTDDEKAAIEKMQLALNRLRGGDNFEDVAREMSSGPTASEGGDRGWIEPDSLVDTEIEEKLFAMKEGEVSDVFERPDRFEIVRVAERRGGYRKSFAEVQSEIKRKLLADLQYDARQNALKKLREEGDVVILWKKDSDE